jgi:hypothetical protein
MSANPAEIRAELERILASPMFCASARSVQFLRFCVEQSLCGNQDQIKETTVALQVFGRNADYNPRTDPIVRVHARRLRDKLEHYYKTDGVNSPIQITMPKGTVFPRPFVLFLNRGGCRSSLACRAGKHQELTSDSSLVRTHRLSQKYTQLRQSRLFGGSQG